MLTLATLSVLTFAPYILILSVSIGVLATSLKCTHEESWKSGRKQYDCVAANI
jgi:hypothetical protein